MSEDWTEWRDHDGKGCPVPAGTVVQVICETAPAITDNIGQFVARYGVALSESGEAWDWKNWGRIRVVDGRRLHCARIVSYRVRTYRAGLDLIAAYSADLQEAADAAWR